MTATDLAALDTALAEWALALVALAAPGDAQDEDDEVQVISPSCVAPAWQQGDARYTPLRRVG